MPVIHECTFEGCCTQRLFDGAMPMVVFDAVSVVNLGSGNSIVVLQWLWQLVGTKNNLKHHSRFDVQRILVLFLFCVLSLYSCLLSDAMEYSPSVLKALERSGDNRDQLEDALEGAVGDQQKGMEFLIIHMPEDDLKSLKADFLLNNLRLAYRAWEEAPWKGQVPESLFFNNVLPYANVNEKRDDWRRDFYERCKPMIEGVTTPAEAAVLINQRLFKELNVKYSTKRNRADQGPEESIRTGLASCTGLSILLIDACRSVGIPARFVGTPLWANKSGNHSWVEVWDNGWHFTGACEPTGNDLDKGWFKGRAATALADHPLHAIYAVSYQKTPSAFPLVWAPQNRSVSAVNVTERYTKGQQAIPEGHAEVLIKVVNAQGERLSVSLSLVDANEKAVFEGQTKDERFDTNDHCSVVLPLGKKYKVRIVSNGKVIFSELEVRKRNEPYVYLVDSTVSGVIDEEKANGSSNGTPSPDQTVGRGSEQRSALRSLRAELKRDGFKLDDLRGKAFAKVALTRTLSDQAADLLWDYHVESLRRDRKQEMDLRVVELGDLKMPFFYKVFGDRPKDGRSLYISMHGGGGAPPQVNDQQWENQKRLYTVPEGIYLAPRAPTNTWNLWHQGHIDPMFQRLIENLVVFEGVNPDKVYLMGYSAGGDGVYQLAPRMADRFAAAAMMAGHPNETSPLGLRNLPYTIHMGGKDAAYKRNQIAADWEKKLSDLRQGDPEGYEHWVKIYPDNGHWMDRKDASAVPWMAKYRRNRYPKRIVWKQDDVKHDRFYWLAVDKDIVTGRPLVTASFAEQTIRVESSDLNRIKVRLNDEMVDLNKSLELEWGKESLGSLQAQRTIATLAKTLQERGDRRGMFSVEIEIESPAKEE